MAGRTEPQAGNERGDGVPTSTAKGADAPSGQTAVAADAFAGRVLSHYRLEERLGGGGMGMLYRATDLKLGRAVAIKLLARAFKWLEKAFERRSRWAPVPKDRLLAMSGDDVALRNEAMSPAVGRDATLAIYGYRAPSTTLDNARRLSPSPEIEPAARLTRKRRTYPSCSDCPLPLR